VGWLTPLYGGSGEDVGSDEGKFLVGFKASASASLQGHPKSFNNVSIFKSRPALHLATNV
jgi:hypothetical protein